MSEIYDNWERLVRATLRREDLKCSAQRTPSDVSSASLSSSFSYSFSPSSPRQVSSFNLDVLCFGVIKAATKNFDPMKKEIDIFSFKNIKASTSNFHPKNRIGEGGSGAVYKGVLRDGTKIAVKVKSKQQDKELINAFGTTYALEHSNIARLLGWCVESNQLLLVYKYMEYISLQHALFGPEEVKTQLNWPRRVKICREVAKGLAYLHEESKLEIVHGNIKPTNILLDRDFTVKIADFEYSQHQETTCSGIPRAKITGHMAPEQRGGFSITPKVDVYSFGVVVLEIVSGQEIVTFRPKDTNIYLLETAYRYQQQGNLIALVDPRLGCDYKWNEALTILRIAMQCVSPCIDLRPTMSEVVKVIEQMMIYKISLLPISHSGEDFTESMSISDDEA